MGHLYSSISIPQDPGKTAHETNYLKKVHELSVFADLTKIFLRGHWLAVICGPQVMIQESTPKKTTKPTQRTKCTRR